VLGKGDDLLVSGSDVYLSGVQDMVMNLGKRLVDMGLPVERLKVQEVDVVVATIENQ